MNRIFNIYLKCNINTYDMVRQEKRKEKGEKGDIPYYVGKSENFILLLIDENTGWNGL